MTRALPGRRSEVVEAGPRPARSRHNFTRIVGYTGGRNPPDRPLPRKRPSARRASDTLAPTPERLRHGAIERLPRAIADEHGRPARPYRTVDTLAQMERRESITSAMRAAGEDFRVLFQRAHLDPLRAASYEPRIAGAGAPADPPGLRTQAARDAVWRTLTAVGGLGSPGGSCLWHVVGLEHTLRQWAIEQGWRDRQLDQETAAGILIATLGMLAPE
jgi:hypothetical protein